MIEDFFEWLGMEGADRHGQPQRYFQGVAQARYVIRKAVRIADEAAKSESLEPLMHQALLQVMGSSDGAIQVNDLAERLDVVPALASRLVKELESRGLVERAQVEHDRRVILVSVTDDARELLQRIDEKVHVEVENFQRRLTTTERAAAMGIFAFYVGAQPDMLALRGRD